jgi:hypothetical protein
VTPIEETLAALHDLVAEGKVRYLGSSNFAGWQVVEADWVATSAGARRSCPRRTSTPSTTAPPRWSWCRPASTSGVGLLPFYPLEYGLLTGKYRRGEQAPEGSRLSIQTHRLEGADFDRIERCEAYAAERGLTMLQVAIGGLAAQPAVASVIAGATTPEQVVANVEAGGLGTHRRRPGGAGRRDLAVVTALRDWLGGLPKVELHVHLVGSASVPTVLELARRHPDGGVPTEEAALREFYAFTDFAHFIEVYIAVDALVRTADDVEAIASGVLADLAAQQVRYVELTVTPDSHC